MGLRWVIIQNISSIIIFSDSHTLVEMLQDGKPIDVHISWTILAIKVQARNLTYHSINKVDRSMIHQAHVLATGASESLIYFYNRLL